MLLATNDGFIFTFVPALWEVIEGCIDFLVNNAFLSIMLVASLIYVGFKVFRKAKKSARC